MNPILLYLLILLTVTAGICAGAHAWWVSATLLVLVALMFGRWAELKFARWIRHIELDRELRNIVNERAHK